MTRTEAAAVLRVLSAAWPTYPLEGDTYSLWENSLATCDFERAMKAARQLVGNEERFPPLARFNECYRRMNIEPLPALPAHAETRSRTGAEWAELAKERMQKGESA